MSTPRRHLPSLERLRALREVARLGGFSAAQPGHFAQRPQAFQAGKMAAWGVHESIVLEMISIKNNNF